jgi:hypothetical protein
MSTEANVEEGAVVIVFVTVDTGTALVTIEVTLSVGFPIGEEGVALGVAVPD